MVMDCESTTRINLPKEDKFQASKIHLQSTTRGFHEKYINTASADNEYMSDKILSSSPSIPVLNKRIPKSNKISSRPRPSKPLPEVPFAGEMFSKKELNEANKVTRKKEELLSEMIIQIPLILYDEHFENDYMKEIFVQTQVEKSDINLPMITWKRKVKAKYDSCRDIFIPCAPTEVNEKNILIYFKAKEFIDSLIQGSLGLTVDACKAKSGYHVNNQRTHIIVMVEGYTQFLNKIKNMEDKRYKKAVLDQLRSTEEVASSSKRQNRKSSEEISLLPKEIDQLVNESQLTLGVNIFPVKNNKDAVNWLHSFTYTIAYALYDKFERNISLANLGTVRSGTDTKSTFFQTIKQFRLMTEPKVEKMYGFYGSIYSLYSRFQTNDSLGKDKFDKNIVPPSTEIAMRKLFTTTDPDDVVHE